MFGKPIRLFTIGGIPFQADLSILFIGFLIFEDINTTLRIQHRTDGTALYALAGALLFILSIAAHEGAHAFIARREHLEVSSVTLYMFGGATMVEFEGHKPREELFVAAAGPLTTFLLAGVFAGGMVLAGESALGTCLRYLAAYSVFIAVFNLIPAFPLDGGRVLRAGVSWATKKRRLADAVTKWVGTAFGLLFAGAAVLALTRQQVLYAVFMGYLAFVVLTASQTAGKREDLREELRGIPVHAAMQPAPQTIDASMTLSEALDRFLRTAPQSSFPVTEQGRFVGTLSMAGAAAVGQSDPLRPVRDAMGPAEAIAAVDAGESLLKAVERMQDGGWVLVLQDGAVAGMLTLDGANEALLRVRRSQEEAT